MYANILLSTDGSDVARKGLKHGIALAKALNAKVTVITSCDPDQSLPDGVSIDQVRLRPFIKRALTAWSKALPRLLDTEKFPLENLSGPCRVHPGLKGYPEAPRFAPNKQP
jgi:nucleotide-binding universal stress UspA family protein